MGEKNGLHGHTRGKTDVHVHTEGKNKACEATQGRDPGPGPRVSYSGGTVTRSEPKVIKPLKGEIGGTGIRSPRVGGQGGMGE